jgi:hypothetical protein
MRTVAPGRCIVDEINQRALTTDRAAGLVVRHDPALPTHRPANAQVRAARSSLADHGLGKNPRVDDRRLRTYLNDHLAGASAAVGTLERLASDHEHDELGPPLVDLRDQVDDDRERLVEILGLLPGGESLSKRALGAAGSIAAWLRELIPGPRPTLAEELEALAIGVWGKRLLWGTMTRVVDEDEDHRFVDLEPEDLAARAEAQEKELLRLRDRVLGDDFGLATSTRLQASDDGEG